MRKARSAIELTREELRSIFSDIDHDLQQHGKKISVTAIGGVSILLQGIRDRFTRDIDIADTGDAAAFQKICATKGIPVDIITIS